MLLEKITELSKKVDDLINTRAVKPTTTTLDKPKEVF
jgi:tetrahydromethanopterin S-methyltransferase subunit B